MYEQKYRLDFFLIFFFLVFREAVNNIWVKLNAPLKLVIQDITFTLWTLRFSAPHTSERSLSNSWTCPTGGQPPLLIIISSIWSMYYNLIYYLINTPFSVYFSRLSNSMIFDRNNQYPKWLESNIWVSR